MAKYRYTNKAVDDLTLIWNYTFKIDYFCSMKRKT